MILCLSVMVPLVSLICRSQASEGNIDLSRNLECPNVASEWDMGDLSGLSGKMPL